MSDQSQEILRLQSELAILKEEVKSLQEEGLRKDRKMEHMQSVIDSLRNMMAYFRKRLFGSMTEKHLPLDPSVLQPTLFDTQLTEEEQSALDAEVKKMEEQNARTIEVKSHRREVRKPVMRDDLPVEEIHVYPEGVNLEDSHQAGGDVYRAYGTPQVRSQVEPSDR